MTNHYRIKRDHRGVTLERTDGTLVHHLPWEFPRLASELMAQHNLDAGHRELLRIYAMGRPTAEYFPVGSEHHNHSDPVCHSRIGYVLPDYEHPGACYLFPQPRAFDGQCHPEPQWQGDYWWQTVRLPVPPGARILDAQPCRDEAGKVVVRWSRRSGSSARAYPGTAPANSAPTGTLLGTLSFYSSAFTAPPAQPFSWADAERVMLAGGECELSWDGTCWTRARINDCNREYLDDNGCWVSDSASNDWPEATWRPCSAPHKYTWEQAEAGMRRTEIWVATHEEWKVPLQFAALPGGSRFYFRTDKREEWSSYAGSVPLSECEWRPLISEAHQ